MSHYDGMNGNMIIGIMNFDTGNYLTLELDYHSSINRADAHISCANAEVTISQSVDSMFVEEFIRNTDCLDTDA